LVQEKLDAIQDCNDASELIERFHACIGITRNAVLEMAAIIVKLDEMGHELPENNAFVPFLRRIAYGQLSVDLFVGLQGKPQLLRMAAALPLPDQEHIAKNKPIMVMEPDGGHRLVPPLNLEAEEIRQVFANGTIRSDAQQVSWLKGKQKKEQSVSDEVDVRLDRKRNGIVVARAPQFISTTQMLAFLSQLSK
jgi:hypothetical protein